jgi:hypothetical protein
MIHIFTQAHKRPDFIKIQYDSIKKNLIGEYEYIVFNNAVDDATDSSENYTKIHDMCKELNIKCIDVKRDEEIIKNLQTGTIKEPFSYTNNFIACAYPIMWAFKNYFTTEEKICLIDSDMFFINKINLEQELGDKDAICIPQYRNSNKIYYMWTAFALFNIKKNPKLKNLDWNAGVIDGVLCDCGGMQHYFLKDNKLDVINVQQYNIQQISKENNIYSARIIINGNIDYSVQFDTDYNLISFNHVSGAGDCLFSNKSFPHEKEYETYPLHVLEKIKTIMLCMKSNKAIFPSPWMTGFIGFDDKPEYFLLHYIAGSNYVSHYTPEYNRLKTECVKKIVYS